MARQRQGQGAEGSLWERAGSRVGNGARALFARLDAQDALDAAEARAENTAAPEAVAQASATARAEAAVMLERLAALIRQGLWDEDIQAIAARASTLIAAARTDTATSGVSPDGSPLR